MHKNKKSAKSQSQASSKTHSRSHAKPHTKPKFRSFLSTKINFLGQATIFSTILCFIFFFLTYFLSNLAITEEIIDFLSYVIISSFFAALLFATLSIFYYLLKLLRKFYKKPQTSKIRQRLYQGVKNYFHRLQQKIKTMDKRPIIAGFIILLSLAIWLLPTFIYNELELSFRQRGKLAETYFIGADEGIYVRQQGGASSYYDTLFTVGDEIERLLKSGLEELEIAQEYNKKQRFWLIFLGKEYKDYHQAKTASVERYYQSYQQFLTQKEQEHLNSNTLYLLAQLQDELPVIIATSFYEHVLPDMPERIVKIAYNRQQLLEQDLINENINQYYTNELEFFLAVYQEIEQKYASGDLYSFDLSIFDKHRNIDATLEVDFRQKANEISERAEEINKDLTISSDSFYELLVDYVKKELNLDQLTKLLAIISNDFPRIKMSEEEIEKYEKSRDSDDDEESEPVEAPPEAIEELVGWRTLIFYTELMQI